MHEDVWEIGKVRVLPAGNEGPPRGPAALRVSAIRQVWYTVCDNKEVIAIMIAA